MKRILLYIGKDHKLAWDASTPEQEESAYLALFRYLDKEWGFYEDLRNMESEIYKRAKKGYKAAAKKILMSRQGYEYEWCELLDLEAYEKV